MSNYKALLLLQLLEAILAALAVARLRPSAVTRVNLLILSVLHTLHFTLVLIT